MVTSSCDNFWIFEQTETSLKQVIIEGHFSCLCSSFKKDWDLSSPVLHSVAAVFTGKFCLNIPAFIMGEVCQVGVLDE